MSQKTGKTEKRFSVFETRKESPDDSSHPSTKQYKTSMGNRQSRNKKKVSNSVNDKSLKSAITATRSKRSSIDIINNTLHRLSLATFGFMRKNVDVNRLNQAPIAIIELCSKWILQPGPNDISINFYKYYCACDSIPMAIELSFDNHGNNDCDINFFDKIFDNRLISKYQINYILIEENENNSYDNKRNFDPINKEFIQIKMESDLLNSVMIPVCSINDSKCFGFTFPDVIGGDIDSEMLVQVNAMDEKDCIVLSSKWKVMYATIASVSHHCENYNDEAVEKYWNEYIIDNDDDRCGYEMENGNTNRNCSININKWINVMRKLEIITDKYNARLIFWFILFNNKSSSNEMKVEDLKEFIYDGSYKEYVQAPQFYNPIVNFRKAIPIFVTE